ncbi:CBM35 domain-containing protein [Streptomyces enissocaesilis]|uniref:CBM35 domain-containing protein n=1 Tax=Streptomyces enissocaesilis TaxID=332589 RepID=UPI0031DE21A5
MIASAAADTGTCGAEGGVLSGVFTATAVPDCSDSGCVAGFDDPADQIAITVAGGAGGLFDVAVVYRSPFGWKQTWLLLNGVLVGGLVLPGVETFSSVPVGRMLLRLGDNMVTLQSNWGCYEIDALQPTPAPAAPPGGFLTDGRSNFLDFLRRFHAHPRVGALGEVGDFKYRPRAGSICMVGDRCVDVVGGNRVNGTRSSFGIASGAVRRSGPYEVTAPCVLGKCLDIKVTAATGRGTKAGTPVQMWGCWGSPTQRWVPQPARSVLRPLPGRSGRPHPARHPPADL